MTVLIATAAAVVVALATDWQIGRESIGVALDASRRWATLRNVHPAFRRALRAHQDRRQVPHP